MDSTSISAIIIDDEPEAINLLEMYLRFFPFIKVVGKETQAQKGLELAMETLPELIFLDIDMPEMTGLQVADQIHTENFHSEIVFTTAHQHYAYDALGIEPLDFLTKPFCVEDIESVLQKFHAKADKKKHSRKLDNFLKFQANSSKIKLPTVEGVLLVDLKDIVLLKSNTNCCLVFFQDGSVEESNRNLNIIVDILNSSSFFQISRAIYINLIYLKRIDKKNLKCILEFKGTQHEEGITKSNMAVFEKLNLFSVIPNR
jgi:DNA-binding LytR/AlgR family response regulator